MWGEISCAHRSVGRNKATTTKNTGKKRKSYAVNASARCGCCYVVFRPRYLIKTTSTSPLTCRQRRMARKEGQSSGYDPIKGTYDARGFLVCASIEQAKTIYRSMHIERRVCSLWGVTTAGLSTFEPKLRWKWRTHQQGIAAGECLLCTIHVYFLRFFFSYFWLINQPNTFEIVRWVNVIQQYNGMWMLHSLLLERIAIRLYWRIQILKLSGLSITVGKQKEESRRMQQFEGIRNKFPWMVYIFRILSIRHTPHTLVIPARDTPAMHLSSILHNHEKAFKIPHHTAIFLYIFFYLNM